MFLAEQIILLLQFNNYYFFNIFIYYLLLLFVTKLILKNIKTFDKIRFTYIYTMESQI